MGFLKRFFSLGSKKSKRSKQQARHDQGGRVAQPGDAVDGEATRLLRSASAHWAEPSTSDSFLAPPLPQATDFLSPLPAGSPAQSMNSMQRRGTYTVTVHGKRTEARTEFPNANPSLPDESDPILDSPLRTKSTRRQDPVTPREQSRLTRLKQDPSVASLLHMYDDNGRIMSTAFSNTPRAPAPAHDCDVGGRAQTKRSGSTLRELLGEGDDADKDDTAEGDISWAERVLEEHAASTSSLPSTNLVETPKDILFLDDHSHSRKPSLIDAARLSSELSHEYPPVTSVEVESSSSVVGNDPHKAPLRAAEVFGFLTERRKSTLERQRSQSQADRPTTTLIPPSASAHIHARKRSDTTTHSRQHSDTGLPRRSLGTSSIGPDISDTSSLKKTSSVAQIQQARVTKMTPAVNPFSLPSDAPHRSVKREASSSKHSQSQPNYSSGTKIQRQSTADSQSSVAASKIPRGPRAAPSWSTMNYEQPLADPDRGTRRVAPPVPDKPARDAAQMQQKSSRTKIPKHIAANSTENQNPAGSRERQHRRTTSRSSSLNSNDDGQITILAPTPAPTPAKKTRRSEREREKVQGHRDKENNPPAVSSTGSTAPPNGASLPLRTIFDVRHPEFVNGDPPSPASSSELSPYTKEMMVQLRRQRMKAREEMGLNGKYNLNGAASGSIGQVKSARRRAERRLS